MTAAGDRGAGTAPVRTASAPAVDPPAPPDPPVLEDAEVFAASTAGGYRVLTVVAPRIAATARPGQLVAARVGDDPGTVVGRHPLYVAAAEPGGAFAGTIQLVVATPPSAGPGARWLARRAAGDRLDLLGPVGRPFPVPLGPAPAVLVGHGYGGAPIVWLAQALAAQGAPLAVLLAAPKADGLWGENAAKRHAGGGVTVVTGDGSAGVAGSPDRLLTMLVERRRAEVIYACGPIPLLRAVNGVARDGAILARVAPEVPMLCGIGVCGSCVVPVRSSGRSRLARSCVEGPALDAARIRWAELAPTGPGGTP